MLSGRRPVWPDGGLCSLELIDSGLCKPQPEPAPAVLRVIIYFNYFFNIPHLMMQIPLSSLSVNVLIQIFLFIVYSDAVILSEHADSQPAEASVCCDLSVCVPTLWVALKPSQWFGFVQRVPVQHLAVVENKYSPALISQVSVVCAGWISTVLT